MAYDPKYDLNKDGVIDQADVDIFMTYYGQRVINNLQASVADFDGSGTVDITDFNRFALAMGPTVKSKTNWLWIGGAIVLLAILSTGKKRRK